MMTKPTTKVCRRLIFLGFFLIISSAGFAQTICDPSSNSNTCPSPSGITCTYPSTTEKGCNCFDKVDNDGDGKIDNFDTDCAYYYGLSVIGTGTGSTCPAIVQNPSSVFTGINNKTASSQNTADTPAHISVGDMDGDGIPDVAVTSKWNSTVQIVATTTTASGYKAGDVMSDFTTPGTDIFKNAGGKAGSNYVFEHETAIADINKDGIGEVFVIASERGGSPNNVPVSFWLCGFKYVAGKGNLSPLWTSGGKQVAVYLGTDRPGNIALADFLGDGSVEIYLRNQIYSATSGAKLADGGGNWDTEVNAGPVAADMDNDGVLELVCGPYIYKVTTGYSMSKWKDMNALFPSQKFYPKGYNDTGEYGVDQASTTSVADVDLDGFLDVFITGAINCSGNEGSPCGTNTTTIFYWNLKANAGAGKVQTYAPPDATYSLGWIWGTGRINLYDVFTTPAGGDNKLEALFTSGTKLFCLNLDASGNLGLKWSRSLNDALSGILSLTCYDFDNDGKPEVVYRDTKALVVCDGQTGATTKWSADCASHTFTEGPIIADVNGDGATDICTTCYTNFGVFDITKSTPQQQSLGQTQLYYTDAKTWLPTRKVWNQHPYYVVNILDNLTIPKIQTSQTLTFTGTCSNGITDPRPFNLFMDQVPYLDNGCPTFPQPDLAFYGDTPTSYCDSHPTDPTCDTNGDGSYLPAVVVTPPICGNLGISAYFRIANTGNLGLTDNIPISFFNGDPTVKTACSGTITCNTGSKTITGVGTSFTTQLSVGSTIINSSGTLIGTVASIASNTSLTLVANATVNVTAGTYSKSAIKLYSNSMTVSNLGVDQTATSPTYAFNGPGTIFDLYVAIYSDGSTLPITTSGSVGSDCSIANNIYKFTVGTTPFTVQVDTVQNNHACPPSYTPANGQLKARIFIGGVEQTDLSPYSFQWYTGSSVATGTKITGATNYNLPSLDQGTYTVQVTNIAKGCTSEGFNSITRKNPAFPNFTITKISDQTICSPPNGELKVSADDGTTGYTYTWMDPNQNAIGTTGNDAKNLLKGPYIVQVTKGTCVTYTTSKTVDGPTPPDGLIAGHTDVVDCLNPNSGTVTGGVLVGGVELSEPAESANYTYNWYFYNNVTATQGSILPASNGTGKTRTKLAAGWYQLIVTQNSTNCASTALNVEVKSSQVTPSVNIFQKDLQTSCSAANPNAKLYAIGSAAGFTESQLTYTWYRGDNTTTLASVPEIVKGVNSDSLIKVQGGGIIYTVKVTTPNNCSATNKFTPVEDVNYPVVTLTQTPNDICDPTKMVPAGVLYDGTVTATVTFKGVTVPMPDSRYSFSWWYNSTTATGAATTITSGGTAGGNTITGLQDGKYFTAVATRTDIFCASNSQNIMVQKASIQPVLQAVSQGSNNCDKNLTPDGKVTVSIITNPLPAGHTYTYDWHEVDPVTGANIGGSLGTLATVSNVGGPYTPNKQYKVDVVDVTNGCTNNTTQSVSDNSVIPVLTTTATPNSICDPVIAGTAYNGTVAVSLSNPVGSAVYPTDFTFTWTKGGAGFAPTTTDVVGSKRTATQLDVNTYTVQATNNLTGCPSATVSNQVISAKVFPTLTISTAGSHNCVNSATVKPDGAATVNITVTTGPYDIQWYTGNAVIAANKLAAGAPFNGTSVTANQLGGPVGAPVSYTVEVTDKSSGCKNNTTAGIPDNSVVPALTLTPSPNSVCNPPPAGVTFNGSITSSITDTNALGTDTYTYLWKNSLGTTVGGSTSPLTKQNGDFYTATVTNDRLGCTSNPVTAQIVNNQVFPALTMTTVPSTNCAGGTANGAITATVNNDALASDQFTFTWSPGNSITGTTITPSASGNQTSTISAQQGGSNYTVLTYNKQTGCTTTVTQALADNSIVPVLTLTPSPNSICDITLGYNGSITSSVTDTNALGTDTYTYSWKNSLGTTVGGSTTPLTGQNGDNYTATVTNNRLKCVSNPVTVQIVNNQVLPALTMTTVPSTNCAGGTANGAITATVNNDAIATDKFTFTWSPGNVISGTTITPSASGNQTSTISAQQGGSNYTVLSYNKQTGCTTTMTQALADNSIVPVLTLTPSPNSICDITLGYNGSITSSVTDTNALGTDTYTYSWKNSLGTTVGGSTTPLTGQNGDNYTATVTNNRLKCVSNPVTVQIVNNQVLPALTMSPVPSTNCAGGAANGAITATVNNDALASDQFTFTWSPGNSITGTTITPSASGNQTSTISSQQGGSNYTVLAYNKQTGCTTTVTQALADNSIVPVLTLTPSPNSICDITLGYNGSITSSVTDTNALGTDTYTYAWKNSLGTTVGGSTTPLTGQNGDNYTATVTNDRLKCVSNPVTVQIVNNQVLPAINLAPTGSTNCPPVADNGSMVATITNDAIATDKFTFTWSPGNTITGTTITPSASGNQTSTISGQAGGANYTVQAYNKQTGCVSVATQTIADNHVLPIVSLVMTQNDVCNLSPIGTAANYDGTVTASITVPSGNTYSYNWSNGVSGNSVNQITQLNVGNYSVTAKDIVTGCVSTSANINVTNNLVNPTVTTSVTPSTNCPGGTANGVVKITGVTAPAGKTYDFKWYDGNTAGVGAAKTTPVPVANTLTTSTYTGVQGGAGQFYTAQITVQETGCQTSVSLAVTDNSVLPVLGPLSSTDNTFCVGSNGTATVGTLTDANNGGAQAGPPYVGYTLAWSNGGSTSTISVLPAGTYSLTAKNNVLNCTSAPVSVNVIDNKYIPVINITQVPQTSCDLSNPNGQLTATIDETSIGGGAAVTAGYAFLWDDAVKPATYTTNAITNQAGNQNYSITVTNTASQCTSTQGVFLTQTLTNPTVMVAVSALTACNPVNGKLVATGGGTAGPFDYFWWDGSSAPDEATIIAQNNAAANLIGNVGTTTNTNDTYNNLVPGDYAVVVRDQVTQCYTSQQLSTIVNNSPPIVIAITDVSLPTTCVSTNSKMSATSNGVTAGYTFDWYWHVPSATDPSKGSIDYFTNPPVYLTPPYSNANISPQTFPAASGAVVTGLPSDLYTLEVTDNTTGCKNYLSHTLPFQNSHAVIKITKTNSTICPYTVGNGSITIEIDNPTTPVPYFTEAGTITCTVVSPTVTGVGTSFLTALKVGDVIVNSANTVIGTVQSITSNTILTLTANAAVAVAAASYKKTVDETDYNVFLYEGGPAITTLLSPTNRTTATSAPFLVANALKPDSYIVGVQETYSGSNCFIYQDVIIDADALPPVISLASAIVDNTACGNSNFNGQIEINVDTDPADMSLANEGVSTTFDITMAPVPGSATFNPNTYPWTNVNSGNYKSSGLAPGTYTFTALSSTGCSSTKSFDVQDNPVVAQLPSNQITITDAEYCTALLEQKATVVVGNIQLADGTNELITDYQFDWVNSASTNVFSSVGNAGTPMGGDEFINNVPAGSGTVPAGTVTVGSYTLTVTKKTDVAGTGGVGCTSAPFSITIQDKSINPSIGITPTGNTACDNAYDGSLLVQVSTASGPGSGGMYNYSWTQTSSSAPVVANPYNGTNNNFTSLQEGTYTLTATNNTTGCSNTFATVLTRVAPPVFTMSTSVSPETTCVPTNGTITVTDTQVDGVSEGGTGNFTFLWYLNAPNTSPLQDGASANIITPQLDNTKYSSIGFGSYYVVAYRATGVPKGSGCASAPVNVIILDQRTYPSVSLTPSSNTSCSSLPGSFEGSLVANVNDVSAGNFTFAFTETSTTPPAPIAVSYNGNTNYSFTTLQDGDYTLTGTNISTGCPGTATTTIVKDIIPVFVNTFNVVPQNYCLNSGHVQVTGVSYKDLSGTSHVVATTDFTYAWTRAVVGAVGGTTSVLDSTAANYPGIGADTYTVTATRSNGTPGFGCTSAPASVVIQDKHINPLATLTPFSNTSCSSVPGTFEGEIKVSVSDNSIARAGVNMRDYGYQWLTSPNPMTNSTGNNGNNLNDVDAGPPMLVPNPGPNDRDDEPGLQDGGYTLQVTNASTGCSSQAITTIPKDIIPVFVNTFNVVPQNYCLNSGHVQVTGVSYKDLSGTSHVVATTDFTYAWTRAVVGVVGGTTSVLDSTAANYPGIGADTYTVTATRSNGTPGFGCTSAPASVVIQDKHINPAITLTPFSNTSCSLLPGTFEGEIKVSVSDNSIARAGVNMHDYGYQWMTSPNPMTNSTGNNGNNLNDVDAGPPMLVPNPGPNDRDDETGLQDGGYTLQVTNAATGCLSQANTTIPKNIIPVFVNTFNIVPQNYCLNSGHIQVTSVSYKDLSGISHPVATTDFTYAWTRAVVGAVGGTTSVLDSTAANYPGIGADTYTVTATRSNGTPGFGCTSSPASVVIQDKHINPIATLTPFSNTSCSLLPGTFEGEIKVSVSDNSIARAGVNMHDYGYQWMTSPNPMTNSTGNNGNNLNDIDAGPPMLVPNPGPNDRDDETGLQDGGYTLQVTNAGTGCVSQTTTTVPKNVVPVFVNTYNIVPQNYCLNSGHIQITGVSYNDLLGGSHPVVTTDFTYAWTRAVVGAVGGTTSVLDSTAANYPGIGADTYTVTATRTTGTPGFGCSTAPTPLIIQDKRIYPVIALTPFSNTACSGAFEGEIKVKVSDASIPLPGVNMNNYSYQWLLSPNPMTNSTGNNGNNVNDVDAGPPMLVPNPGPNDRDYETGLQNGDYTLQVTNTATGCNSSASTNILLNGTPVFTQLVTPRDQVMCKPDGKLSVDTVKVIDRNGNKKVSGIDFPITDFHFTYDRTSVGNNVLVNSPSTVLDSANYYPIAADSYYVTATRVNGTPGNGCSAPAYKVDIQNKQILPSPVLTPFANTSCSANFEGEITVLVTDASVNLPPPLLPGPNFKYTYNWLVSATPAVINGGVMGLNDGDGSNADGDGDNPKLLSDGDYTIQVRNTETGCVNTASTTIFKNSTPVFTQLVTSSPQVYCLPSGHLKVDEVRIIDRTGTLQSNKNGDFLLSDFDFTFDRTTVGNTVFVDANDVAPHLDSLNYPPVVPNNLFDTYYVTAKRVQGSPGKGCPSAPYRVDIEDKRVYPTVNFTAISNSTCPDPLTGLWTTANGSLTAHASEPSGANTDPYTFVWTLNGSSLGVVTPAPTRFPGSPKDSLANALNGDYIATVTNTVTGCSFPGGFKLLLDSTRSTPNIIDVVTIDPVNCNPTAGAEVTKITLGSITNSSLYPPQIPPDNTVVPPNLGPPRFVYTWYEGSLSNPPLVPTTPCVGPACPAPTTGLLSGDHWVTVIDKQTNCQSGPKQFLIKTNNIIYPVAAITQLRKQISCDPTFGTAILEGSATEQDGTTGNYNFYWYPTLNGTGAILASTALNPNDVTNLNTGNYSMVVQNTVTSCYDTAIFIIPDESPLFKPVISTGTAPQTFCTPPFDGDVNVRVVLDLNYPLLSPPPPATYDNTTFRTDLYKGTKPNLNLAPDVQSNIPYVVTGNNSVISYDVSQASNALLVPGKYTFKVTDLNTGCVSTDSVEVLLQQELPTIEIASLVSNINCKPALPNGQITATAGQGTLTGLIQGYKFRWFVGSDTSTYIPAASDEANNILSGIDAGTFTVKITNDVTGCLNTGQAHIDSAKVKPPVPTPVLLHNQTLCYAGKYNGHVTASVGGVTQGYSFMWYNTQDNVIYHYFDYDSIRAMDTPDFYTVRATDQQTQCYSEANITVPQLLVRPTFNIVATPSYCSDSGDPIGTFTLTPTVNDEFKEIAWSYKADSSVIIALGPVVLDLYPGEYHVHVTTEEGCQAGKDVDIETEIRPYNLVSPNSPNKNDRFTVDCISNFPGNNVKIFNRNGTLVYEADGYDNQNTFFRGVGEKGVYLSDKELPEGTYFYIIDKRNGTKPRAGYLELVR